MKYAILFLDLKIKVIALRGGDFIGKCFESCRV